MLQRRGSKGELVGNLHLKIQTPEDTEATPMEVEGDAKLENLIAETRKVFGTLKEEERQSNAKEKEVA